MDLSAFEYLKLAIYYAGYLYFPAAVLLIIALIKGAPVRRTLSALLLAGLSILAYARFVEPRIDVLNVRYKAC